MSDKELSEIIFGVSAAIVVAVMLMVCLAKPSGASVPLNSIGEAAIATK